MNTITQVEAEEYRYEDPHANSFKFYRIYTVGTRVLTQWGRIGALGQFKALSAPTERQAQSLAANKISEKRLKGYEFDSSARFGVNSDMAANPSAYAAKFSALFDQFSGAAPANTDPTPRTSVTTERNMNKLMKTALKLHQKLSD